MKVDRIAGTVFFLIGAFIAREGTQLPYTSGRSPGAGFLPLWLGIVLMLLSVVLLASTRRPNEPFIKDVSGFRKVCLITASFLVYIFALSYLGLLLALTILLAFLIGWVERGRWQVWVSVAGLGSLSCYLLFEVWLGVPLPIGMFGI